MALFLWTTLGRGVGTGALVDVIANKTSTRRLIKSFTVSNPTAGALTLIIKVIQSAALDTGTARNAIPGLLIGANQTYTCPELINQMLEGDGKVQLQGNGLEYLISGAELLQ